MHPSPAARPVRTAPLSMGRPDALSLAPRPWLLCGLLFNAGCSLGVGCSQTPWTATQGTATNIAGAGGIGGERPPGMGGSAGTAGSGGHPGIGGSAPIAGAGGVGGSASPPSPTGEIATRKVDELRELTAVLFRDPLDTEQE